MFVLRYSILISLVFVTSCATQPEATCTIPNQEHKAYGMLRNSYGSSIDRSGWSSIKLESFDTVACEFSYIITIDDERTKIKEKFIFDKEGNLLSRTKLDTWKY